jgi:uncharacterized membrane protein
MENTSKKATGFIAFGSILITWILVKTVYGITGFHYEFSDGIVNIKLLIDIVLWGIIYFPVNYLLKKLFAKQTTV